MIKEALKHDYGNHLAPFILRQWRVGIGVSLLLLPGFSPSMATACSCVEQDILPVQEMAQSTEVFSGRVVTVTPSGSDKAARLLVERVWKGDVGRNVILPIGTSTCSYHFVAGERYIVYAHNWNTSVCSRTRPLSEAQEDLVVLGAGARPKAITAMEAGLLLSSVIVLVLSGLVMMLRRRIAQRRTNPFA